MIVGHVDDLLFTGNEFAKASLDDIGKELGFGAYSKDDFVWCGKRIYRHQDGTVRVSMEAYHRNLSPTYVSKQRRANGLNDPLSVPEIRTFKALCGALQWVVAQLRVDLSFRVSALQGENRKPSVGSLLRANALMLHAKATGDFELIFRPVDLASSGMVVVTDAALGNVTVDGDNVEAPEKRIYSQGGFLILLGDKDLMSGKPGKFNLLDFRSHRMTRVCRSSYAAETYALEEGVDSSDIVRGFLSEMRGVSLEDCRRSTAALDQVECMAVVDAKDTHDKCSSDTSSHGAQKSLAFTVGYLKQYFRRSSNSIRWVETENQLADCLTKDMDTQWFRQVLSKGQWCVTFRADIVRPKTAKLRAAKREVKAKL